MDFPPWIEHLKKPEPVKLEIELKDDTLLDNSSISQTPQKNESIIELMNSSVNNLSQTGNGSNKKSRKNKEEKKDNKDNKDKSDKQKSSSRGEKSEKMLKNKRKHSP